MLTITIPTFNRPEHIRRQVRDLLPQLRAETSLIVYDNCSDIPVSSLFTQEELSQFIIVRNRFNIGGVANIGKCLAENGETGWIWLLGDDDRIADNAVDFILKTINNHQECCFINFQQKQTKLTSTFLEFLDYMKIIGAFGVSFFQSACLFNMDKLSPYVMYYYEFISSWVGQIAMVIKYLEHNPNDHCFFTADRIIIDSSVGGWSHLEIIVTSSILIDRFNNQKKIMRKNLFKALGDMDFTILAQEKSSFSTKWFYRSFIIGKLGYINVLKYNKVTYGQYVLSVLLPSKLFARLRACVAMRYKKYIGSK